MLSLPYARPFDFILYVLFGLEIVLLAGGLVLGTPNADRTCRLPLPLRMSLSAILLLAAFLGCWAGARGTAVGAFAALILGGMSAGFVGDLVMARVIPTPNRLIFGMGAFGLGHVFYLAALLNLSAKSGPLLEPRRLVILGIVLVACTAVWYRCIRAPGGSRALNLGSLVYGLLIGGVAALTIGLALQDALYLGLAMGAVLFLTSDLLLGNWVIQGHVWPGVNDVIWGTYVCGQLLVVYSVAPALNAWR
jgi:hypothetical protein